MKSGAINHLKTKRLKHRLGLPLYAVVGILETLWQLTAESADEGDIGRFSNEDIALGLDWSDDPNQLVTALVDTGWLDRDDERRLVVHDWAEHAPEYIKERLRKRDARGRKRDKSGKDAGQASDRSGQQRDTTGRVPAVSENVPSIPNPTTPNPTSSPSVPPQRNGTAPAKPKPTAASPATPRIGWEEEEAGLARLGVKLIKKALDSACQHGFTQPQVAALIAYLESNPPGCTAPHGAIYNRLVAQAEDSVKWDATANWPWSVADPAAAPAGDAYPVRPETPESRAAAEQRERDRLAEQDLLIASHSDTLRTMNDADLDALIGTASAKAQPDLRRLVKAKGRDSPAVHMVLLDLIDKRAKAQSD